MFNLRHLQYLDAVYQYKNFTQAADAIFVSQPAISTAISTLESELGVKLIVRSSKNVIFTCEGEEFMKWVHKILGLCTETENAMKDLADSAERQLKLGMSYAFMDAMAPMVFSDFLGRHPKAHILLDEGSMNRHLEMIEKEQLDLAYNGFPDMDEHPDIELIPISKAEIRLVLHPEHPLASLDSIPIELLGNEQLVMMDAQSKVKEVMSKEFETRNIPMNIALNYTQILCMVGMVKSCRYIGIISEAAGHKIPGCDDLVLRSFKEPVFFDLGFFFKKDRYLPKLGWDLIKFLKDAENNLPA